jgi:hypothetical protein
VGSAEHAEVPRVIRATERFRDDMVDLEKRASFAAPAVSGNVRALNAVALVDLATDGVGHARRHSPVSAALSTQGARSLSVGVIGNVPRALGPTEALPFELFEQQIEAALDDDG